MSQVVEEWMLPGFVLQVGFDQDAFSLVQDVDDPSLDDKLQHWVFDERSRRWWLKRETRLRFNGFISQLGRRGALLLSSWIIPGEPHLVLILWAAEAVSTKRVTLQLRRAPNSVVSNGRETDSIAWMVFSDDQIHLLDDDLAILKVVSHQFPSQVPSDIHCNRSGQLRFFHRARNSPACDYPARIERYRFDDNLALVQDGQPLTVGSLYDRARLFVDERGDLVVWLVSSGRALNIYRRYRVHNLWSEKDIDFMAVATPLSPNFCAISRRRTTDGRPIGPGEEEIVRFPEVDESATATLWGKQRFSGQGNANFIEVRGTLWWWEAHKPDGPISTVIKRWKPPANPTLMSAAIQSHVTQMIDDLPDEDAKLEALRVTLQLLNARRATRSGENCSRPASWHLSLDDRPDSPLE